MAVQLGHFVYENAGNGCLLSKYCNQGLQSPLTECAKRVSTIPGHEHDPFCGIFCCTWVEDAQNMRTVPARLTITRKRDAAGQLLDEIYTFDWRDLNNPAAQLFYGEAMAYKDMLLGAYQ